MAPSAKTQVCGIFGHPVGHSLSPALHNAAFEALGLDFVYVAHDVAPDSLEQAIAGARAMGYRGLSITIPHKIAAARWVDSVDPTAARIGCINTIVREGQQLLGYNSDGLGAVEALRQAGAEPRGRRVVVLGSGGAARALAVTLADQAPPAHLTLLGIDEPELEALRATVAESATPHVETALLNEENLARLLPDTELLLQTTPVGMAPNSDRSLVPARLLHSGLTVFDAVYTPRRTRLLTDAARLGATVVEGLEMFLGQALVQFRLFTGCEPPVEVMRAVVEAKLGL